MVVDEDLKKRSQRIRELLLKDRLREALELIKTQMASVTDWSVLSRYEDIESSYNFMLQYFSQGSPDEHRTEVYRQLIRRALILNDDVLQAYSSSATSRPVQRLSLPQSPMQPPRTVLSHSLVAVTL